MGGHSDICAGAVAASREHIDRIFQLAKNLGGSLSDQTTWMLERSLKTLGLRVKAQSENALRLARHLQDHPDVSSVYYPGLESHPGHAIARAQMHGFGGMLSFELAPGIPLEGFVRALKWVRPSMSLAGVESTLTIPTLTSHALLSEADRQRAGIRPNLIRFSAGIEDFEDLSADLDQAIASARKQAGVTPQKEGAV